MKVFQVEVYTIHDYPDYHQFMLKFYGRQKYKAVRDNQRCLADDRKMLYADLDRTVFTHKEVTRLRDLLFAYSEERGVGLLGYSIHQIELPEVAVATFKKEG